MIWRLLAVAVALFLLTGQVFPPGAFNSRASLDAAGGGGVTFSLAFAGHSEDTGGGTTVTFTAVAMGAANANRVVAVPIAWRSAGDSDTISSVTIGGVSATQATGAYVSSGGAWISDLWYASVPTGTSGDIVFNFSAASARSGIATYRVVTGTVAPTDVQNATATAGMTVAHSLTIPGGGKGLAFFGDRVGNGGSVVWTGAVSDYDATGVGGFSTFSGATVSATGTVTADDTPLNTFSNLIVAAWGP